MSCIIRVQKTQYQNHEFLTINMENSEIKKTLSYSIFHFQKIASVLWKQCCRMFGLRETEVEVLNWYISFQQKYSCPIDQWHSNITLPFLINSLHLSSTLSFRFSNFRRYRMSQESPGLILNIVNTHITPQSFITIHIFLMI